MRIRWTTPALDDLDRIQDFVARDSQAAAHKLVREVYDRTMRLLGDNPRSGRSGRDPTTRELVISRTPSIVVYRLSAQIDIVAVVHAAREWPDEFG